MTTTDAPARPDTRETPTVPASILARRRGVAAAEALPPPAKYHPGS